MNNELKASDLRIGNYVKSRPLSIPRLNISSEGIMKVTGYGISVLESDTTNKLGWKGISLTPEILERCGFDYYEDNDSYQLDTIFGFNIWGRLKTGFTVFIDSDDCGAPIFYLHQLQNLYHALTGEELNIQL